MIWNWHLFCWRKEKTAVIDLENFLKIFYISGFFYPRHTIYSGRWPQAGRAFQKGIEHRTAEDLLRHYPYKYVDRSRFYMISEISENMPFIQLKGKILKFEKVGEGRSQRLIAVFTDGRQYIELVWFKGLKFVAERYKTNIEYVVSGNLRFSTESTI